MIKAKNIIIGFIGSFFIVSCTMEPTLSDNLDAQDITTIEDARTLINGAYAYMKDLRYLGRTYAMDGELRADNVFSNGHSGKHPNSSKMKNSPAGLFEGALAQGIFAVPANPNIVLALNVEDIEGNLEEKKHIYGEAYAIRAMVYFDIIRIYGQAYIDEGENLGISYVKKFKDSDVEKPRGSIEENKEDLYSDVENAIKFLKEAKNSQYAQTKTYFTLDAAYALKSRIATYFRDYKKVIEASEEIYGKYQLNNAEEFVEYWKDLNVGESSIFELPNTPSNNEGSNGMANMFRGDDYGDIQAFDNLIEDAEFDKNDIRASKQMIDYEGDKLRNMGKYPTMGKKMGEDNIKVFRYAEVVLNYAEALIESNPQKALLVLNEIPKHRNAMVYTEANFENILKERRKEFLFEGFRSFDLARFHKDVRQISDNALNQHGLVKAGSYRFAMPIPQQEIDANSNTVQNPGY